MKNKDSVKVAKKGSSKFLQKPKTIFGGLAGILSGVVGFLLYALIGGLGNLQHAVTYGNWFLLFAVLAEIVLGGVAVLIGILVFPSNTVARKSYLEGLLITLLLVVTITLVFVLGAACTNCARIEVKP